jgi:hypothetical protein
MNVGTVGQEPNRTAFDMECYKSRLTQEIWNVVNYLRSLGPRDQAR